MFRDGQFNGRAKDKTTVGWKVVILRAGAAGGSQILGVMNQFYKYDKGGVGAYNLAHSKPTGGAQHCLISDEHREVFTVVCGLL